ncbi:stress response protein NST1-like, partial [Strongylocentrotus purpuratus]|uniref:Uncharacterized protein n=1 Tax=Strongylocentrotus purpuratus TaxID=7668 RepID=A0A7M7NXU8_STRPU
MSAEPIRVVPVFLQRFADVLAYEEYSFLKDIQPNRIDSLVQNLQQQGGVLATQERVVTQKEEAKEKEVEMTVEVEEDWKAEEEEKEKAAEEMKEKE